MRMIKMPVTCDTAGAGTTLFEENDIVGLVYAVQLIDGTFADGVDVTVTVEQGDLSIPILAKVDFNTDQMVYPRAAQALNTDGTALTSHCMPIAIGQPKVVIAQGGDGGAGAVILYVLEDNKFLT